MGSFPATRNSVSCRRTEATDPAPVLRLLPPVRQLLPLAAACPAARSNVLSSCRKAHNLLSPRSGGSCGPEHGLLPFATVSPAARRNVYCRPTERRSCRLAQRPAAHRSGFCRLPLSARRLRPPAARSNVPNRVSCNRRNGSCRPQQLSPAARRNVYCRPTERSSCRLPHELLPHGAMSSAARRNVSCRTQ